MTRHIGQFVGLLQPVRIEDAAPRFEHPAANADPDLAGHAYLRRSAVASRAGLNSELACHCGHEVELARARPTS